MPVPGFPPSYADTDFSVLQTAFDRLLEPRPSAPPAVVTSTQWTTADLLGFLTYRTQRFLRETGLVVARLGFDGTGMDFSVTVTPNQEPFALPQNMVDVLRLAFVNYAPIPYSGVGKPTTLKNSGDNQNFFLPAPLLPGQYAQLFLNGLLEDPGGDPVPDYAISYKTLTLANPLSGTWNLQLFIGTGTPVTPLDSGDHQNFTIPVAPNQPQNFQLFNEGQLLDPIGKPAASPPTPPDYVLTGTNLVLSVPYTPGEFNLQGFVNCGMPMTPIDSGDHQHFTVTPANPVASFQQFLNGQLLQPGTPPNDYLLSGASLTLAYVLSGTWTLQSFVGGTLISASSITEVPREDFMALDAYDDDWETTDQPIPRGYTQSITDTLQAFLAHPPSDIGAVDLTFVATGPTLTGLGVPLPVPGIAQPAILAGLLADCYAQDGEANNPQLAAYMEMRYLEGIELCKALLTAPARAEAGFV